VIARHLGRRVNSGQFAALVSRYQDARRDVEARLAGGRRAGKWGARRRAARTPDQPWRVVRRGA
jgi:hypothetical protein